VYKHPQVAARGALPAKCGLQCMMLLPTAETVASVAIGLMPLCMEQPYQEDLQGSSPQDSSIYKPMHPFSIASYADFMGFWAGGILVDLIHTFIRGSR
jgi:hypothetical protein